MSKHRNKNDSAWMRINRFLVTHSDYIEAVNENTIVLDAYGRLQDVMNDLAETAGLAAPSWREVPFPCAKNTWLGRMPYDNWVKQDDKYLAEHRKDFANAANDLRKACRAVIDTKKALEDFDNVIDIPSDNPGGAAMGIADAHEG